jgi:hypothetical protein
MKQGNSIFIDHLLVNVESPDGEFTFSLDDLDMTVTVRDE